MKPVFVAIEGIDGAGKTTLANQLAMTLRKSADLRAIDTAEPFTSRWRDRVCDGDVMASTADRAAHIEGLVAPKLSSGCTVITDRYYLSCAAYVLGTKESRERTLADQMRLFPVPDLWVWLCTDVSTCVDRVRERGESAAHLAKLHAAYCDLWPLVPGERLALNTTNPLPTVLAATLAAMETKQ